MDYTFEVSTLELNAQLPTVDFIRIAVINSDPLALSLGLGDCSVLYHRSMQVGTLSLPIGSSTGSVFLDPMIWAISAAVAQLQLRPVDVRTGTLFASTGLPLSIGLPAASVLLKRALTASPLALQATLGSVGYRRGAPLWSISALGIQLRLNTVNISYTSFYEIPLQVPTSREFTPPSHSLTQARTQSGTVVQRVWASRPGGGSLRLRFANIADASAQQLAGIWDRAKGRFYSVVLPEKLFQGMSQELLDHFQLNGSPLKWAFAKKPVITSVMPGVSSVEMEFTARGYGGQALPVVTTPDPPRSLAIQAISINLLLPQVAMRIQVRTLAAGQLAISLQLKSAVILANGNFIVSALQLNLQASVTGFSKNAESDPYWATVALLLQMDGVNGSTTFIDSSTGARSVTAAGNAQISTTQSRFGGSSGSFSTGYITLPAANEYNLNANSFCIEFWVYFNSVAAGQRVAGGDTLAGGNNNWAIFTTSAGRLDYYLGSDSVSGTWGVAAGQLIGNISTGQWYHVALVRNGTSFTGYLNGVAGASVTSSAALRTNATNGPRFGTQGTSYFNGYVDEVRITNGQARYTSSFTPPSTAFPAVASPVDSDPGWSMVSLLLSFDGANGSTTITDKSSNANAISVFGAAAITTVDQKYGTGALNISNSAGAYVQTPASALFQFGTGDFTVEFWANPLSNQGNQGLFTFGATSSGLFLAIFNGNWMLGTAGSGGTNMGGAVTGWQHVAVTRSGTSLRLFIGGAQKGGTLTNSTNLSDNQLKIGYYFNTSYPFNGRLDEFRVTKGIARYTTAFTPSGPFPLS